MNFKLTAEELEKYTTPKTKVLVLPFPNNPTGAIMTREDLEPIAKFVEEHDLYVMSDEIYSELTYKEEHVSIASLPGMRERTLVINGFSKGFAMTGWRASGILCRTGSYHISDDEASSVCNHVCAYKQPVCGCART